MSCPDLGPPASLWVMLGAVAIGLLVLTVTDCQKADERKEAAATFPCQVVVTTFGSGDEKHESFLCVCGPDGRVAAPMENCTP